MKSWMPADGTRAATAIVGISARPAGSSGKMLHQPAEQAEGLCRTFLLQCMSSLVAHRGQFGDTARTVAIGLGADIVWALALDRSVANGPKADTGEHPML